MFFLHTHTHTNICMHSTFTFLTVMVYEFFSIIKLVINTIIYYYMVPHNHMLIILFMFFLHTHTHTNICMHSTFTFH